MTAAWVHEPIRSRPGRKSLEAAAHRNWLNKAGGSTSSVRIPTSSSSYRRPWIKLRRAENFPDGEIFTGTIEEA